LVTKASKYLGKIECICCGEEIPVKENDRGTLNVSCFLCGITSHSKLEQTSNEMIRGWIRKKPDKQAPAVALPSVLSNESSDESATAKSVSPIVTAAAEVAKITKRTLLG